MNNSVVTIVNTKELDMLLTTDKDMQKKVRRIMSKVLAHARTRLTRDAKVNMKSDPRKAYLAVKRSVYKMLLGGNVSILAKRKASSTRVKLNLERKVDANPNMRGGNRRKRSSRTEQIDSYYGSDRGFILRFVNAGTSDRKTKYGRRGRISARNWFGDASVKSLNEAAEEFVKLIEKEVNNITHNGK